MGGAEAVRQPGEFIAALEWRIDQHQPAPFIRRHESRQRRPAVEVDHTRLLVIVERVDQLPARIGLKLAGDKPILRPQKRTRHQRRPGIGGQIAMRIEGAHDVEIGRDQHHHPFGQPRLHQPRNAGTPFAAALGFAAGQVVQTCTGMGITRKAAGFSCR